MVIPIHAGVRYPSPINNKGETSMAASRLTAFVFVSCALMAAAIASGQQAPPSSNSSNSAAPAAQKPTAAQATTAQPTKVASAQTPSDPSPEFLKQAREAGFKPTQVRGSLMFCRVAVELGSNFPVRTCYDEAHAKTKIDEYQAQRDQLRQGHFLPPGMPAGCSARSCQ